MKIVSERKTLLAIFSFTEHVFIYILWQIFKWMDKMIKESQAKQLKLLSHLEEREKEEVKKWIHSWRKDEYKRLSKLTRDKSELDRMKREVSTQLVEKGVEERAKKTLLYKDIRAKLEQSHQDILKKFEEYKVKVICFECAHMAEDNVNRIDACVCTKLKKHVQFLNPLLSVLMRCSFLL